MVRVHGRQQTMSPLTIRGKINTVCELQFHKERIQSVLCVIGNVYHVLNIKGFTGN